MSEWIMTQNGAVCKSEVALIIPQDDGKGKKNIVIITKDKIAFSVPITNICCCNCSSRRLRIYWISFSKAL